MKTVEELFEIIVNSPISPKPSCDSLSYIWNWRDHIESSLTQRKLKNHSFYNAFKICREDSHVKLKVKRLPQDLEWLPPTGIRLLKPNSGNEPVGCADFRVEDLMLSRILANLEKYWRRMPTQTRFKVADSWLRLKENLEKLPRMKKNLPTMKISSLPRLSVEDEQELPDEYSFLEEEGQEGPEIEGDIYEEGLFNSFAEVGLDVVVYTKTKAERPWVGRIHTILENQKFVCQWYRRHGKSSKFHAMTNPDGTPYVSELEFGNVMMWNISSQKTENSIHVTPHRLAQIGGEYDKYDINEQGVG